MLLPFLVSTALTGGAVAAAGPRRPRGHHAAPTVLSVFDGRTSEFVDALSSELYDRLRSASFEPSSPDGGALTTGLRGRDDDDAAAQRKQLTVRKRMYADKMDAGVRFGESLTLSWQQDEDDDDDVVALYCPADEPDPRNFRDAATVAQVRSTTAKLDHAAADATTLMIHETNNTIEAAQQRWRRTAGEKRGGNKWRIPHFPVIRARTCEFRLWRRRRPTTPTTTTSAAGAVPALTLAGRTGSIPLLNSLESPTSIHLALTSDPTRMTVHFNTGATGRPIVQYGPATTTLGGVRISDFTLRSEGTSTTYRASDMCQPPANVTEPGKFVDPGQLHTVTLTDLTPDVEYGYRVGLASGQGVVWSPTHTFTSPPPVGSNQVHSYIVYGDQGCPEGEQGKGGNETAHMVRREIDDFDRGNRTIPIRSVHHFGDLSYARGSAHLWDAWLNLVEQFAARVPLMVGIGNHEYDHTAGGLGKDPSGVATDGGFMPPWGNFGTDSGGECGVPTARRFKMPVSRNGNRTASNGVFWYSYNYGMVHTVVVSSEHDLSEGSKQHAWLEDDLRATNRTLTPWVIVESHRPMYHSEPYWSDNAVGIAMRAEFETLLHRYKVDAFFAGHYHSYLRTCDGLYASVCDNGGPIHITVGTAGAGLDDSSLLLYDNVWTKSFKTVWGYGRVTVYNETTMLFEFVRAKDGSVEDELWIRREREDFFDDYACVLTSTSTTNGGLGYGQV